MSINTRCVLALGVAPFLAACVFTPPNVDVAELREFPEYGGWLPIDSRGRVVAQLVRPDGVDERRERWYAPTTREAAQARIDERRRDASWVPLQSAAQVVTLPAAIAMLPVVMMVEGEDRLGDASELALATKIELELRVVDTRGHPLEGAHVLEIPSVASYACWQDGERRFFGQPRQESWQLSTEFLRAATAGFEPDMVQRKFVRAGQLTFYLQPKPPPCAPGARVVTDASGRASLTSHAATPLTVRDTYGASVWRWRQAPARPLTRVVAWAPGYESRLVDVPWCDPGGRVAFEIELESLPDGDWIRAENRRWLAAYGVLDHGAAKASLWKAIDPDFESLEQGRVVLLSMASDASLPPWMQHSIDRALRNFLELEERIYQHACDYNLGDERAASARDQVRELRRRIELAPLRGWPSIGASAESPGQIERELQVWIERAAERGLVNEHAPGHAELIASAGELLARGEALDVNWPLLEIVRAASSIATGDVTSAKRHARLLDNDAYLALFHAPPAGSASAAATTPR